MLADILGMPVWLFGLVAALVVMLGCIFISVVNADSEDYDE